MGYYDKYYKDLLGLESKPISSLKPYNLPMPPEVADCVVRHCIVCEGTKMAIKANYDIGSGCVPTPKPVKGKGLAKTQGPLKEGFAGFDLAMPAKPETTEYQKEKAKIKHFYKMMDDAYTLIKNYEKLIKKLEIEKQAAANPPPKGVTFTL